MRIVPRSPSRTTPALFDVQVEPGRWFDVVCATDPSLLRPEGSHRRNPANFYGSAGRMRAGHEPIRWAIPATEAQRLDSSQLYYALQTYGAPDGRDARTTLPDDPTVAPFVTLDGLAYGQAPNWCNIRNGIIRSAEEMGGDWLNPAGGRFDESHRNMLPNLQMMWRDGVQARNWRHQATESAADRTAWSAAFVSWAVRNAGTPANGGFRFSGRHMDYIVEALRNRLRGHANRPFWFFGIAEAQAIPQPGDIVCMNRRFRGRMTQHSLDSLRRRFWDGGNDRIRNTTGASHCDIALGYKTVGGRRFLEVTGGNRGDTVGNVDIPVDAAGRIQNPGAWTQPGPIFGVVKLTECPNGWQ